jgi:hypothetical protein
MRHDPTPPAGAAEASSAGAAATQIATAAVVRRLEVDLDMPPNLRLGRAAHIGPSSDLAELARVTSRPPSR